MMTSMTDATEGRPALEVHGRQREWHVKKQGQQDSCVLEKEEEGKGEPASWGGGGAGSASGQRWGGRRCYRMKHTFTMEWVEPESHSE